MSENSKSPESSAVGLKSRRDFLKQAGVAVGALGAPHLCAASAAEEGTRTVWVASDAHAGRVADELDGAEWLARACTDMSGFEVDYALFLGDLTQNGTEEELQAFLKARATSKVETWHELAGNHEYRGGSLAAYEKLVRNRDPYRVIDGNVILFFLSDEAPGVPGNLSGETCDWLEAELAEHKDKTIIVCSHQLVRGTIHKSDHPQRHIQPSDRLAGIIEKSSIDLWMCGHEHHSPYTADRIARKGGTTYVNVASVSHAYNTEASQSFLLELNEGAREIVARRRQHDTAEFLPEFEVRVPLRHAIVLG